MVDVVRTPGNSMPVGPTDGRGNTGMNWQVNRGEARAGNCQSLVS